MLSASRPLDMIAVALAVALGLLALTQWYEASQFSDSAVSTTAEIVELREEKKVLLDAQAAVFATVRFESADGAIVRAELPTAIQRLGLDRETAVGSTVPVSYDPSSTQRVRYGRSTGSESAVILALLAIGALFAPLALRSSALRRALGGGGG